MRTVAGKTTTIRMLLALQRPTGGRATVLGLDCGRDSTEIHRRTGYLPGELALYPRMTGRQHIAWYARARGLRDLSLAEALAERFGAVLDRPARELSKGNRQKVGLVLAFMARPELLVLDEPTSGLDPLMRSEFGRLAREVTAEGNIYANFFPLIMLLLTIGYGAACLAGQDEDGTLSLLTLLPVRRTAIVAQKAAAMTTQAALLTVTVAVFVILGRSFQLDVTITSVASVSAAVFLLGLDFGLVTMAIGAPTGRRGTAVGAGTALAAASYLVSSLAPAVSRIRPGRYASCSTGR